MNATTGAPVLSTVSEGLSASCRTVPSPLTKLTALLAPPPLKSEPTNSHALPVHRRTYTCWVSVTMAGVPVGVTMPLSASPRKATIGLPDRSSASENGTVMPSLIPEMPPAVESEPPSSSKVVPVRTRRRISVRPLMLSLSQAT